MLTLKHLPRELAANLLPLQTSLPSKGPHAWTLHCNRCYWTCPPSSQTNWRLLDQVKQKHTGDCDTGISLMYWTDTYMW